MSNRLCGKSARRAAWLGGCAVVAAFGAAFLSGVNPAPAAAPVKGPNTYGFSQVEYINELIRKGWADHEMSPSPVATDGEWCRRVFLDILGRTPSVEELLHFMGDRSPNKKADLVERLLNSDSFKLKSKLLGKEVEFDYLDEYADNWATLWTNILIGRPKNNQEEQRSLVNREGMTQYLRRSFQKNKKYDQMVFDLVSARGNTTPGAKGGEEGHLQDFNGAANFLIGNLEEDGVQATAKTAQIFLGLQVQCTQCHNHPFNEWKQNQFWEFNAFFRQTKAERHNGMNRRMVESADLINKNFNGDKNATKAEIYYELRNGTLQVAYPVFVDGRPLNEIVKTDITATGKLPQYDENKNPIPGTGVDRRYELAKLMVQSDYMPKAIVNRMWAHFMGYGFTKPIDDMGPHNTPTHPELLDRLAADFAKNSFDLKQLITWIVLSEPYSLSAKFTPKNKMDDPALGEKPQFSHFYLRQMRAEELYESLLIATQVDKVRGNREAQAAARGQWLQQFTIAFGTDEGDDTTTFNGTIPQALMMFNGDLVKKATAMDSGSFLEQVANNSSLSNPQKITYLYMAALARAPSSNEAKMASMILDAKKGDVVKTLQDVWWAVLNSNEFILNH